MRIINEGIAALSFSEIKAEISQISVIDYYRNGKLSEVIECFENEKRKNVLSIKTRIEKELDSYLTEINRV